jgi:GNAT superfamily N-acetyltransferase
MPQRYREPAIMGRMPVTIRPMRPDDVPRAAELATQLGYPSTADEVAARFAEIEAGQHDEVLVATDGADAVIGWIHVARVVSLAVSETVRIGGLVVDESHRSAGIGAELVAAGEAWARQHGARIITVSSRTTRERAHRFYENLGYAESKRSHVFAKPLV